RPRDLLGGFDDGAEIGIGGSTSHMIELHDIEQHRHTDLGKWLGDTDPRMHSLDRLLPQQLQTSEIDRGEFPAVRPVEVDKLASGKIELQHPTRLVVDHLPCPWKNGSKIPFEYIHCVRSSPEASRC